MCGIYGILALSGRSQHDPTRAADAWVTRSCTAGRTMRGPSPTAQMLLGMRRLSIIDVAGGHQPITNEDGSVVVVCNGEIYNYRAAAGTPAGCRPPVRHAQRHRSHRASLRRDRRCDSCSELEGMFGLAAVGSHPAPSDRGPRCPRHQADLLSPDRARAQLCFRSQGDPALPGATARAGSWSSLAQYLAVRLRLRAELDVCGHSQAAARAPLSSWRTAVCTIAALLGIARECRYGPSTERAVEAEAARRDGARRPRPDGQRRADRRVSERRHRFERRGCLHEPHSDRPGARPIRSVSAARAARQLYNELPYARQVARAVRHRSSRDRGAAGRGHAAAANSCGTWTSRSRTRHSSRLTSCRSSRARTSPSSCRASAATSCSAATRAISTSTTARSITAFPRSSAAASSSRSRGGCRATGTAACSTRCGSRKRSCSADALDSRSATAPTWRCSSAPERHLLHAATAGALRRLHRARVRRAPTAGSAAATHGRRSRHAAAGRPADADGQDEHGRVARVPRAVARSAARRAGGPHARHRSRCAAAS